MSTRSGSPGTRQVRPGSLSEAQRYARERALEALSLMRRKGLSLTRAAKAADTDPRTVRKYLGPILQKGGRRYQASPYDRLSRRLRFLTPTGVVEVSVRGSRQAGIVADYWNAVDHYLRTGDGDPLRGFNARRLRSRGKSHQFITDERMLERLALAGEVAFEDLYASVR